MRIECAWCKTELGEKCPNCGSRAISCTGISGRICGECHLQFDEGEGGVSSTICRNCVPANLPARLTEEEIVARAVKRGGR
jgi:hypothetical protein